MNPLINTNNLNSTAQMLMIVLVFVFISGIFIFDKVSYLVGAFIMYLMCSIVLNKMKAEIKELDYKNREDGWDYDKK